MLATPIGETRQICGANKFSWIFYIRCTSPIGGVRIAEPIVLAWHKGNEGIGEVWTPIHRASPIVIEITY